jgi:PAS domain S-box-containing protein
MTPDQRDPTDWRSDGSGPSSTDGDDILVLHVDDDPALLELAATCIEQAHDAITVVTATSPTQALDVLTKRSVDCVVSDYNMPGTDGLALLRDVRDEHPDLPFILYTGRGSEEIASEAISVGVTDYLQKEGGTDQYTVLANRIANAVGQYRAERAVEETRDRFRKLIEESTDVISVVDANGRWQYLSPSAERVLGYEPDELVGEIGFDRVHPDDRPTAMAEFARAIENPDTIPTVEFRFDHPDGWIWLENYARNMVDDPVINGLVVHTRDVTERTQREQELARQNERLEEVIDAVSHDLRSPLHVATSSLELADDTAGDEAIERTKGALDRMDQIINDLVKFAREGEQVDDLEPVDLDSVAKSAWKTAETREATLTCEGSATILANRSRLQRILENLFQNAAKHGGDDVTVFIGPMDDGFYVEDTGVGLDGDDADELFKSGYSTVPESTGFGLSIVKQIVQAHDWEITVTEGRAGGARFEITGVTFP